MIYNMYVYMYLLYSVYKEDYRGAAAPKNSPDFPVFRYKTT